MFCITIYVKKSAQQNLNSVLSRPMFVLHFCIIKNDKRSQVNESGST